MFRAIPYTFGDLIGLHPVLGTMILLTVDSIAAYAAWPPFNVWMFIGIIFSVEGTGAIIVQAAKQEHADARKRASNNPYGLLFADTPTEPDTIT